MEDFECALLIASELDPGVRESASKITEAGPLAVALSRQPSVVFWSAVAARSALGLPSLSVDGNSIELDPSYVHTLSEKIETLTTAGLRLHRSDPWLRLPFGATIEYESQTVADDAQEAITAALDLIDEWSGDVARELEEICSELQLIVDPAAPDRIVSFSDDAVPGSLYVSVRRSGTFLPPAFLADSIIHEYRHQKLYLLQHSVPLLKADEPLVSSPWRDDPRPPSGLLHAVFVFAYLLDFWRFLRRKSAGGVTRDTIEQEITVITDRLDRALPILRDCELTPAGETLVDVLEARVPRRA